MDQKLNISNANSKRECKHEIQHTNKQVNKHDRHSIRKKKIDFLPRQWVVPTSTIETSHNFKETDSEASQFVLMTYNILGDKLMKEHKRLYEHADRRVMAWSFRKAGILKEISILKPDVLCLQEVEDFNELYSELLQCGYSGMYQPRAVGEKPDGLAFFYRADKFKIVTHKLVQFCLSSDTNALMNRQNVGIVAGLQEVRESGKFVCVATTHLLFNPKRGDVKLGQLAMLFAEIDLIKTKLRSIQTKSQLQTCTHMYTRKNISSIPVIVCGDFNFRPQTDLFNFILDGKLEIDTMKRAKQFGVANGSASAKSILPQHSTSIPVETPSIPALTKHELKMKKAQCGRFVFPSPELSQLGLNLDCRYSSDSSAVTHTTELSKSDQPPTILCHSLTLRSAYERLDATGREMCTTFLNGKASMVDYVFYTDR
eukprot:CFRG0472T1